MYTQAYLNKKVYTYPYTKSAHIKRFIKEFYWKFAVMTLHAEKKCCDNVLHAWDLVYALDEGSTCIYLPLHLFDPEFLLFLGGLSRTEQLTQSKP